MKYIYIYSADEFKKEAADHVLLAAWRKGKIERYTPEEFAAHWNEDMLDFYNSFARVIDENDGWFHIVSLHRKDLSRAGFKVAGVDDDTMKQIANDLWEDYCEERFRDALPLFADKYGLERKAARKPKTKK